MNAKQYAGKTRHAKRALSLALAFVMIFALLLPGTASAAPGIEINLTTNSNASRFGPGSTLFVLGYITNGGIPLSGAPVTVNVEIVGGAVIYQGAPVSNDRGLFSASFNIPDDSSLLGKNFLITARYGGAVATFPSVNSLNGGGSVINFRGCTFPFAYSSDADFTLTADVSTQKFGVGFSGNVNYFNRNSGTGGQASIPPAGMGLDTTVLGPNTANADCLSLFENSTGRRVPISVNLTNFEDRTAIPHYNESTFELITNAGTLDARGTLFFTASETLKADTVYRLVLSQYITANSGNRLGYDITVYFKTSAAATAGGGGGGGGGGTPASPGEPQAPAAPQSVSAEATAPTEAQTAAANEAVANAAESSAANNVQVESAGAPFAVSGGDSPAITTVSGAETAGATVMAMVNEDGGLTPVPTKINADGTVTVLIIGDVVLVPLSVWAGFTDVSGHWAESEINRAASLMIVEGVGNGEFNPAGEVSGAEAVTMFLRAMGLPADKEAPALSGVDQDAWYAGAVNTAAANGLITAGFAAGEPMTRIQTAEMICFALAGLGMKPDMTLEQAKDVLKDFTDLGGLTDEQLICLGILVKLGVFKGNGDGTISPSDVLQRVHMASLAVRFQDLILG